MTTGLRSAHAVILVACCSVLPLKAQTAPPVEPAQVLLLGVYHFAKVAVEDLPSSASRLDSLYEAYRAGRHELSRNETQQLGFRLAAGNGHSRVYPVDYRTDLPFDDLFEYAKSHDPDFLTFMEGES